MSKAFTPAYVTRSHQRLDMAQVRRLKVLITVPPGLTRDELESNMRHAVMTAYSGSEASLGAVTVSAWTGESTDGPFSAAMATFAPHGQWKDANEDVFLEDWKVVVEFAPGYFEGKPAVLAIGAPVTLANDADGPRDRARLAKPELLGR